MARENQGLQIALIIFVMLAIILGVTTYLFYRQYDEALKGKAASDATASKNEQRANKNEEDANELKRLIGVAKTEKVDAIGDTFKKDMEKYGAGLPEETRFYRPLLEKLRKTIDEKNAELADTIARIPKLEDEYKTRGEARDLELKQFQESRDKAGADLAGEQAKFQAELERKNAEGTKLHEDLQAVRKETTASLATVETKLQDAEARRKKLADINEKQAEKIERYDTGKIAGTANGQISWVNQRNATVWINLGRADSLARQISFSVYPSDITNMTTEGKKGSIEVTQILGDHLAEARVLDDNMANPLLPGDKIYTPLWSPGEKKHFALAGLIDVDDDGKSDLQTVMNLITLNGGVVDCYIADSGKDKDKQVGQITVNTNCLILGAAPTEKGLPAFTKILRDADQVRLQKIQLGDMLQRMGWKNLTPVVRFGRGANPKDFRAKPEEGVPKKSTGNVSDLFMKRVPPKAAPTSAY